VRTTEQEKTPYIQHVGNYCRINSIYFDKFCKTENPENPDLVYAMLTVFGEARSESDDSIKAIAWVIRNSLKLKKWGKSYKEVVLSQGRFDCWKTSDANYQHYFENYPPRQKRRKIL